MNNNHSNSDRLVIVPAWGAGLYADFNHVVQAVMFAESLSAHVVVCWGNNSLYYDNDEVFSSIFKNDDLVFQPVDRARAVLGYDPICTPPVADSQTKKMAEIDFFRSLRQDLDKRGYCIFSRYLFSLIDILTKEGFRQEDTISSTLYKRLHKPIPSIIEDAENFMDQCGRYICGHIRGTEKVQTPDNSKMLAEYYYDHIVERLTPNTDTVVVITEDPIVCDYFHSKKLPIPIKIPKAIRESIIGKNLLGRENIEQAPIFLKNNRPGEIKLLSGKEVVRDVTIAIGSDVFLGSESNVSRATSLIRGSSRDSIKLQTNFLEVLG